MILSNLACAVSLFSPLDHQLNSPRKLSQGLNTNNHKLKVTTRYISVYNEILLSKEIFRFSSLYRFVNEAKREDFKRKRVSYRSVLKYQSKGEVTRSPSFNVNSKGLKLFSLTINKSIW